MQENLTLLTASANQLFSHMQEIVEDRQTPVIEAHLSDFYATDRETLGSVLAPGMKLLWLMHPCGTHLGEVGILHPEESYMRAVLKTYQNSYAAERMELHLISVDERATDDRIAFSIRPLTIEAGQSLLRTTAPRFSMRNDTLVKGGEAIAQIAVRMGDPLRSERGYSTHIVSDKPLSRLDAMAANMHASRIAASRSDLFSKELACTVNGEPFDALYPRIIIDPVLQGRYAPLPEPVVARERQTA